MISLIPNKANMLWQNEQINVGTGVTVCIANNTVRNEGLKTYNLS